MKYSIVIPTLNEIKLLPGLLDQINNPELRKRFNIEVIISDGGSKDGTLDIANKGSNILKQHKGNKKQNIPEGRNSGAFAASGDILVFINADVLFSDVFEFFTYLDNKFKDGKYLALTCNVKVFPWEENLTDRIYHWCYNNYFKLLNLIGIGMGRGECQVIRKSVFDDLNGYNEEMAAGEDFDLFRRVKKKGRILFARNIFVYESPRRYRKFGYKTVTLMWIKNGLSVLFKNKSLNKEWEQVR